jgi:hypothetical protein
MRWPWRKIGAGSLPHGRAFDEPNREDDRAFRINFMQYYMSRVPMVAGDNNALEADRLDIMSALRIARDYSGKGDLQQSRLFVKAVMALARFLGFRNALDERVTWGKAALEIADGLNDNLAVAELCASTIAWPLLQQGKNEDAELYSLRGLEAAQKYENPKLAAKWAGSAARTLSGIARDSKDGDTAYHWAAEAAAYARSCDDQLLARGAELDFGYAALLRGDFLEAENRFRALLEFEEKGTDDERIGNRSGDVALAIMNRAIRAAGSSEKTRLCRQARALVEHALFLAKKINHAVLMGECEISLAVLELILDHPDEHDRLLAEGRRRFTELGIQRGGRAEQFVFFQVLKVVSLRLCVTHLPGRVGERDNPEPGKGRGHPVVGRGGWHGGEVRHAEHVFPLDEFSRRHHLSSDLELGLAPSVQGIINGRGAGEGVHQ